MNETNSTEVSTDVEFEHSNNNSEPEGGKTASKGNGSTILIVVLVLLLVGGLGFWLYDQQQDIGQQVDLKLQAYSGQISELSEQIESENSKVSKTTAGQQSQIEAFKNDLEKLTNQQQVLEETLTVIENEKPKQRTDWVLAEVGYLLTIAQERLSLERDIPTAIAAMQAADRRLRDMGNPNINSVREKLIKEINALRDLEDADISGMVLFLADVASRVESLPLKDFAVPTLKDIKIPTKEEAVSGSWKDMLLSMWGDLVKIVEIKDQEVPDEILFDPEKRYFLQQNLQLELSSAKLSVLQRDSQSMKAALERVDAILKRYFDTEKNAVKSILNEIVEIQKTDLKPGIPNVTEALNELKLYQENLQDQDIKTEPEGEGETAAL